MDLEWPIETGIDSCFAIECDESKASWSARVLVHHEGSINDSTELHKVLFEVLLCGLLADTTNEDLASTLLLISGNCPLGVDLATNM